MNDAPSGAGVDDGAPLREPLTIADAARRAGVHPNTIRRLIKQGRVAARLVRGRYGDTWLVESVDIDRAVGGHAAPASPDAAYTHQASGQTGGWSGSIDAPDALPAATDLSLDRARALERYTHGLLQPLVELLREREAAVESRDELIRTQAERIGRLERELELLRAYPGVFGQTQSATPPQPAPERTPSVAPPAAPTPSDSDDLPEHVTSLAGQVGRLRAELQLIASALQGDNEPAGADAGEDDGNPEVTLPEAAVLTSPVPAPPPLPAAAVTVEEMAGLFPAATRGRLTLEPLQDGTTPPAADDPFAEAAAAVSELRRALGPESAGDAAENGAARHEPAAVTAAMSPAAPQPAFQRLSEARPRRWWWPW